MSFTKTAGISDFVTGSHPGWLQICCIAIIGTEQCLGELPEVLRFSCSITKTFTHDTRLVIEVETVAKKVVG